MDVVESPLALVVCMDGPASEERTTTDANDSSVRYIIRSISTSTSTVDVRYHIPVSYIVLSIKYFYYV